MPFKEWKVLYIHNEYTEHRIQFIEWNRYNTIDIIQWVEYNAQNTMYRIQNIE